MLPETCRGGEQRGRVGLAADGRFAEQAGDRVVDGAELAFDERDQLAQFAGPLGPSQAEDVVLFGQWRVFAADLGVGRLRLAGGVLLAGVFGMAGVRGLGGVGMEGLGDVQAWVTTVAQQRSPATVRKIYRVLSLVLALAVSDGRLARNPATGVRLPRPVAPEHRYLTHPQVDALADAAAGPSEPSKHGRHDERRSAQYRLIVLFLAYTGVRFGELAALRVGRIDFLRRRATIAESVTLVNATQVWGTPKGHERREVPIPPFLVEELAAHVAGKAPDDLVFSGVRGGGALRAPIFRRAAFDRAADAIGMTGLHPHELRHTAASLAKVHGIAFDATSDAHCDCLPVGERLFLGLLAA